MVVTAQRSKLTLEALKLSFQKVFGAIVSERGLNLLMSGQMLGQWKHKGFLQETKTSEHIIKFRNFPGLYCRILWCYVITMFLPLYINVITVLLLINSFKPHAHTLQTPELRIEFPQNNIFISRTLAKNSVFVCLFTPTALRSASAFQDPHP